MPACPESNSGCFSASGSDWRHLIKGGDVMKISRALKVVLTVVAVAAAFGCDLRMGRPEAAETVIREDVANMKTATFGAGCFWGVEAAFRKIEGVVATQVGYTGGTKEDPTYQQVCRDRTGHAEAVEVTYDPSKVSYDDLLDVFWAIHDPTQLDRQGPDYGSQYRSAIFFHDAEQETLARASKERLVESGRFKKPMATEIVPALEFYRAEEYHQQYYEKRGGGACLIR